MFVGMPTADETALWLRELLTMALARGASEIRIQAGQPPALCLGGTFYDVAAEPLSAGHVAAVLASLGGDNAAGIPIVIAGVGSFGVMPLAGGATGVRLEPLPAEPVDFRAYAPPAIAPGSAGLIDVWACLPSQAAEVARRAAGAMQHAAERPLARGTRIGVRLAAEGLRVKPALQTLVWHGEPASVSFVAAAAEHAHEGRHAARARLFVEGLPIGELHFVLTIGAAARAPALADAAAIRTRWKSAFASYATEDRAEVDARVQRLKAMAPEMDVFVDALDLRAGEGWKPGIEREISLRERVFLFWSRHARGSQWVDFEWRLARKLKGIDAIDPVPLDDAHGAPPPLELAALCFDDAYLPPIAQAAGP
jgi:hypothetical protein